MPYGPLAAVGMAYSVIAPVNAIRPTLFALDSTNHIPSSGPAAMLPGPPRPSESDIR